MAKRFTDTNKWRKPFIRGLQGAYKLFWFYLLDDCDHAGIWIVDIEVAQIRVGQAIFLDVAKEKFADKIVEFDNGERWFIPDFIEFQYGVLNENNRAHNSVINVLLKYKLLNENKVLIIPLQGVKDKDKDKELDKDKEKGKGNRLMRNSNVLLKDVSESFKKSDDLKYADAKYYFNAAMDWSDGKGEIRKDWIAVVRGFARKDIRDGKLKVSQHKQSGGTNKGGDSLPDDYGIPSKTAITMPDSLRSSISKIGEP